MLNHSSSVLASRLFKRFYADAKGVAAMQFAFCAPLLFFVFLNVLAVYDISRANRQAAATVSSIADLATRWKTVDDDRLAALFSAAGALGGTYTDDEHFEFVIASVVNLDCGDDVDDPSVEWVSSSQDGEGYGLDTDDLDTLDIPYINDGEGIVIMLAEGAYEPAMSLKNIGKFSANESHTVPNIEELAIRRPRFVTEITYSGYSGPENECPTADDSGDSDDDDSGSSSGAPDLDDYNDEYFYARQDFIYDVLLHFDGDDDDATDYLIDVFGSWYDVVVWYWYGP